jgi:PKHD-type hydroxylase
MQLTNNYFYFKSVISPEDCQKIIETGNNKILEEEEKGHSTAAWVHGGLEKQSMPNSPPAGDLTPYELSKLDLKDKAYVRDSNVSWLSDRWIYDLIYPHVMKANEKAGWRWNLDGSEMFQFTKYQENGFYGWHEDGQSDWYGVYQRYIPGITKIKRKSNGDLPRPYTTDNNLIGKVRKISLTLNLNKPGEYEGGDLKFDFGLHKDKKDRFHVCEEIRPQGSIIVFPSFLKHCVTPVTKGTRYSLVLWTLGEPWQ